ANKPKVAMLIVILTLISSYALNVKLIPILGLSGAAAATTITAFFGLVLVSIYTFVKFKALISLRSFFNITLASLITYFLAYFWNLPGKLFFISLSLLSVLYILLLVLLKEIKDEDKEIVKSLLKWNKG
ncbi:MAG: polysaccharide biosynthesis C-terminal domain-containing protein, partial [Nanoarchaeota archaeon]